MARRLPLYSEEAMRMKKETYTIDKLFYGYNGNWQMPPFTDAALASQAQAAFERINSGLEMLKDAIAESARIHPKEFHNSVEIYLAVQGAEK